MLFRLNIRRSKGMIWMLNIAAILCITLTFFMIYKKKASGQFKPQKGTHFTEAHKRGVEKLKEGDSKRDIDINDYSAIWKANISGVKEVAAGPEIDGETEIEDPDPLSDILNISVILKSYKDPSESMVRLNYLKSDPLEIDKSFTLKIWNREGDALKSPYDVHPYNGKILKINKDEVLFSYKEKEVTLALESLSGKSSDENGRQTFGRGKPKDKELAKFFESPPPETVMYKPDHFMVGTEDLKKVRNNYKDELDKMTLAAMPNPATGKTELKLTQIQPGAMASKQGFQTGDTLISINGVPIHNKAGAINYFKDNPDMGKYEVVISRNGKLVTKTFNVPKE